eukprot:TRINITY_DN144_c0_g1_i2.p1 TRINITY_DN144_c0_g1~~TRINITY_DN144_c0_g1_i2.p1  ORF type:complete len:277 (+),score=94.71 TRINITY_DN144_c0_g1_i2:76-906(+)
MRNCGTTENPVPAVDEPVKTEVPVEAAEPAQPAPVPRAQKQVPAARQSASKQAAPVRSAPASGSGLAKGGSFSKSPTDRGGGGSFGKSPAERGSGSASRQRQAKPAAKPAAKKGTDVRAMHDAMASVARRAGWDSPKDSSSQQKRKPAAGGGGSRRRKGAPARVERELPKDFEVDEDDDAAPRKRATKEAAEGEDEVVNDSIGDDGLQFLAEVTQYAQIDTKVDAEQAAIAGLSEHDYEQARVKAEQRVMEDHAKDDYREKQTRTAADEAIDDALH